MPHEFVYQYGGICGINKRRYGHRSYSVTRISKATNSPSDFLASRHSEEIFWQRRAFRETSWNWQSH